MSPEGTTSSGTVVLSALRNRESGQGLYGPSDVYSMILGVVMGSSIVLYGVGQAFAHGASDVSRSTAWLPSFIAVASALLVVQTVLVLGPALARADTVRWILPTPLDRGLALRRNLWFTGFTAVMLGSIAGLLSAVTTGDPAPRTLWGSGIGGAVVGAALHQACLAAQALTRRTDRLLVLVRCAAFGLLFVAVVAAHQQVSWRLRPSESLLVGLVGAAMVFVLVSFAFTQRWLRRIRTPELVRTGQNVDGLMGLSVTMDGSPLELRAERRRLAQRAQVRSTGRGRRAETRLALADAVSCWRRRSSILGRAALVVGVWVLGLVFGSVGAECAGLVVAMAVVNVAAVDLRLWSGSTSLPRSVPVNPRRMTAVLCLTPAVLGAVTGLGVVLGGGVPLAFVAVCGLLCPAVVLRRSRRPEVTFGETLDLGPMGSAPAGLVRAVVHGYEMLALCLVVGIGFSWLAAAGVAAVCLGLCLIW